MSHYRAYVPYSLRLYNICIYMFVSVCVFARVCLGVCDIADLLIQIYLPIWASLSISQQSITGNIATLKVNINQLSYK